MTTHQQPKVLFFGVHPQKTSGHFLYDSEDGFPCGRSHRELLPEVLRSPDAVFCPHRGPQQEGLCRLHFVHGWTLIGFWDRSGDGRGNSNSNFFAEGRYSFKTLVELARQQYPGLFKRFTFPLVLQGPDLEPAKEISSEEKV